MLVLASQPRHALQQCLTRAPSLPDLTTRTPHHCMHVPVQVLLRAAAAGHTPNRLLNHHRHRQQHDIHSLLQLPALRQAHGGLSSEWVALVVVGRWWQCNGAGVRLDIAVGCSAPAVASTSLSAVPLLSRDAAVQLQPTHVHSSFLFLLLLLVTTTHHTQATPFDPTKSSTARWLSCSDKKCQCGVPACSCKVQGQLGFKQQQQADKGGGVCYYKRHYGGCACVESLCVFVAGRIVCVAVCTVCLQSVQSVQCLPATTSCCNMLWFNEQQCQTVAWRAQVLTNNVRRHCHCWICHLPFPATQLPVAEESSSEGWLVADQLHLAAPVSSTNSSSTGSTSDTTSSGRTVEVVFGCEDVETGEIYNQVADGVLGMGNNENSLPRQVGRVSAGECEWGERGTVDMAEIHSRHGCNTQFKAVLLLTCLSCYHASGCHVCVCVLLLNTTGSWRARVLLRTCFPSATASHKAAACT